MTPAHESMGRGQAPEPETQAARLEECASPEVAVLGNVLADISAHPIDRLPADGALETDHTIAAQIGGSGGNCATCLGRLSRRVALIGRVGDDDLGDMLLKILEREGVDCSMVRSDGVARTCVNLALTSLSGARRDIQDLGANANVVKFDVDWDRLEKTRLLYIGGVPLMPRLPPEDLCWILATASDMGIATFLSPSLDLTGDWPHRLPACLQYVDVLRLNEADARLLSGDDDTERAASIFLEAGCAVVVTTLGPRGHIVFERDAPAVSGKVFDARVADRAGAGEAFDAGYITGAMQDLSPSECARWGAAVAAFSVRGPNAFASVPGIEAVRRSLRQGGV